MSVKFRSSHTVQLDPLTLYRLLQLRTDVFVVEQQCAYPELDGRDIEPGTVLLWGESDSEVIATLRILRDQDALRIGRVTVRAEHRGTGLAKRLFQRGIDLCATSDPQLPIVLDAQQPLEHWYGTFGFESTGEVFLEDGIPHMPMRRGPVVAH